MTGTQIEVVVGDIADVASHQADAYVVAANNELWMGSGVAGALKRAAGEAVEQEAIAQGPIEVGDAILTSSGQMTPPTKALIHAAAMGFTDRTQIYASKETVSATTRRSLELCDEHGLTSIVFPALGTGIGALEQEDCAEAMCAAIASYLSAESGITRICFVVTNDERAAIFQKHIDARGLS
jgi:O-acetyl-ADP-ribose deacetylase (regulator of RNase III)